MRSNTCRSISTSASLNINLSPVLLGQPLKKKHRIDPAVERSRQERRKRKLEKKIRLLERQSRLLKPVEELLPNFYLKDELHFRSRHRVEIPLEELERRSLLLKAWSKHVNDGIKAGAAQLSQAVAAQEKALEELKSISPRLYEAAVAPYNEILPYTGKGPMETPPVATYNTPDGNYVDKSKKWIITASGELI